jgi:hypothetical protein
MPFCFRESWVFTACLTLVKATAERHLARTHAAAAAAERDFYRLQVSHMSKDIPFLDASGDPWGTEGQIQTSSLTRYTFPRFWMVESDAADLVPNADW